MDFFQVNMKTFQIVLILSITVGLYLINTQNKKFYLAMKQKKNM